MLGAEPENATKENTREDSEPEPMESGAIAHHGTTSNEINVISEN